MLGKYMAQQMICLSQATVIQREDTSCTVHFGKELLTVHQL